MKSYGYLLLIFILSECGMVRSPSSVPNDPDFSLQWYLHNRGQSGGTKDADIGALGAWELETGSSAEVVVAVLDAGVDYTHPDLAENVWINTNEVPDNGIDDDGNGFVDDYRGWDFYNNDNDPMDDHGHSHGTHVAGIIGAVANNGIGISGVSQQIKILPIKFQSGGSVGSIATAVAAIDYAILMDADIISNSWLMSHAWPEGAGYSQKLKDAIERANQAGILFVATTGNSRIDLDQNPMYPAAYDNTNIITVAGTDYNDELSLFSNFGVSTVDLAAPAGSEVNYTDTRGIYSTKSGGYQYGGGTSFATPQVAGAAALLKAADTSLTHLEIKQILMDTVDPLPGLDKKTVTGGRLNVEAALKVVRSTLLPDSSSTDAGIGNER